MPKKPFKFDPLTIEITFRQNSKGQTVIGYAGDDDRTPVIGEIVLNAITAALESE